MKQGDVTTDDVDEVPAEKLRHLSDIFGVYARDILHWHSIDVDDVHLVGDDGGCQSIWASSAANVVKRR